MPARMVCFTCVTLRKSLYVACCFFIMCFKIKGRHIYIYIYMRDHALKKKFWPHSIRKPVLTAPEKNKLNFL